MTPILQIEHVSLSFGGVNALTDVSFQVQKGQIYSLIGPNGAGKTSLLNSVSGFYHPQQGSISFDGQELNQIPPHKRARLGIARTFQNIELFQHMSVLDNLMLGAHNQLSAGVFSSGIYWKWAEKEELAARREIEDIIDFLEIENIRYQPIGQLSYGLQKRVELGRALALRPQIILMDEPMAGMTVEEKQDMVRFIIDMNEEHDTTILLIEHDMGVVMDVSDYVTVLDFGRLIGEGTPAEIRKNQQVIEAYIGQQ